MGEIIDFISYKQNKEKDFANIELTKLKTKIKSGHFNYLQKEIIEPFKKILEFENLNEDLENYTEVCYSLKNNYFNEYLQKINNSNYNIEELNNIERKCYILYFGLMVFIALRNLNRRTEAYNLEKLDDLNLNYKFCEHFYRSLYGHYDAVKLFVTSFVKEDILNSIAFELKIKYDLIKDFCDEKTKTEIGEDKFYNSINELIENKKAEIK